MKSTLIFKSCISIAISFLFISNGFAQEIKKSVYSDDFELFWKTIREEYAYWDKKQTDWERVHELYQPVADTISSKQSFILFLERVFNELYDHHASLNTNTSESQRLVPSGTDIWAEYINGKAIITELRPGFGAANQGMVAGMELIAFNGIEIEKAILPFLPKTLKKPDPEAKNYALRVLLAGNHINERKITVNYKNQKLDFYPDKPENLLENHGYDGMISSSILKNNTGYIKIHNNLGDNDLIRIFDSVLMKMKSVKALILDLRETPGGGNTTVARAIMGSFISKAGYYQKHELSSEEFYYGIKRSWMEIVSPRKNIFSRPLIILVNYWTGSVAEGIVIGFDALKRGKIIGTPMAALNGAVYSYTMPNTNIGFSFPCEKLFHINGMPRENFKPHIIVETKKQKAGEDLILKTALQILK
jgi:carboxyl-terminal processing protease